MTGWISDNNMITKKGIIKIRRMKMDHRIKRMVSIMLSFALVLCSAAVTPVAVNAAGAGESYSLTLEGMMNWMLDTKNLTDQQRYDIQRATTIINDAKEESFSQWYGGDNVHFSDDRNDKITDLSDVNDAVNLRQMPVALQKGDAIYIWRMVAFAHSITIIKNPALRSEKRNSERILEK